MGVEGHDDKEDEQQHMDTDMPLCPSIPLETRGEHHGGGSSAAGSGQARDGGGAPAEEDVGDSAMDAPPAKHRRRGGRSIMDHTSTEIEERLMESAMSTIAERVAKRKALEAGMPEPPSATQRMAALRQRLHDRWDRRRRQDGARSDDECDEGEEATLHRRLEVPAHRRECHRPEPPRELRGSRLVRAGGEGGLDAGGDHGLLGGASPRRPQRREGDVVEAAAPSSISAARTARNALLEKLRHGKGMDEQCTGMANGGSTTRSVPLVGKGQLLGSDVGALTLSSPCVDTGWSERVAGPGSDVEHPTVGASCVEPRGTARSRMPGRWRLAEARLPLDAVALA